jgi:lipoprotein signal peptidase
MAKSETFNRVLIYVIAVLGVAADQATKYGVFAWLSNVPGNHYVLFRTTPEAEEELHGFALVVQHERSDDAEHRVLTYADGRPIPHVNQGALFGFLRDHKTPANLLFAVISLVAAAGIGWWSMTSATVKDRRLCVALGLILAGTLGNLYDRVVFNGVRDFLHWDYLYNWPVFNVADCCLVAGAGLLIIQAFAKQPAKDTAPGPKEPGRADLLAPAEGYVGASAAQQS